MEKSLKKFRDEFLHYMLEFLWRQWSQLGMAGRSDGADDWVVDPEALLLFTCAMGRYDARLFDEVLDWLDTNGRLINIQRLKTIQKRESLIGGPVLSAVSAVMEKRGKLQKWRNLTGVPDSKKTAEDLFLQSNNEPLKKVTSPQKEFAKFGFKRGELDLRGYSREVPNNRIPALIFKLRSLFGLNARSEIVAYLLTHDSAHPTHIAREIYFYQKTVQDALVEMQYSGVVRVRPSGRQKMYWLYPDKWEPLLEMDPMTMRWINWAPLFSALEMVWKTLSNEKLLKADRLLQSSEIRKTAHEIQPLLIRAGFPRVLSDDRHHLGEDYLPVFHEDITLLFEKRLHTKK